jgi:hypothetical protein
MRGPVKAGSSCAGRTGIQKTRATRSIWRRLTACNAYQERALGAKGSGVTTLAKANPVTSLLGVPLSSEPKRTLTSVRANLSVLETQLVQRCIHLQCCIQQPRIQYVTSWRRGSLVACGAETRTDDLHSEITTSLFTCATVRKCP